MQINKYKISFFFKDILKILFAPYFLHVAGRFFFGHVFGRYATSSSDRLLDMARRNRGRRRVIKLVRFPVLTITPLLLFLNEN